MEDEHPETEIKLIEQYWIRWAGPPMSIKTDASGSHMSEKFVQWTDSLGIKLIVIPKEAHYRLGVMERAHAVRRAQLMKMHDEYPDLELEEAARYTAEQRNRLRTVHGSCPLRSSLVPFQHNMASRTSPSTWLLQMRLLRSAFGSCVLLPRRPFTRSTLTVLFVLQSWPARAPSPAALSSAPTSSTTASKTRTVAAASLYLPAGGVVPRCCVRWKSRPTLAPALWCTGLPTARPVRCAPEQLRPELPLKRAERLATAPASEVSDSVFRRVARALRPVRGPVRFLDLTTGPSPAMAGEALGDEPVDGEPRDEPHLPPPPSSSTRTRARRDAEAPATEVPSANVEAPATEVPSANVEAPATEVPSANTEAPATEVPSANTEAPATEVPVERAVDPVSRTTRASEVEVSRERSRSPARQRPDQMDEVTRRSLDRARAVDGLPPVRDPVRVVPSTWSTNFAENDDDVDDALIAESELREKSFTDEQKAEFDEAKDNALRPWTENQAWTRAKASEAAEGHAVPMRFLLKYKSKDGKLVANARIILQGFKHVDVTEKKLDTESPTLSRIGKNLILFLCCQMKWKVWTADVKSAFLQADRIDTEVKIYAIPNADIRRRLSRQIGLRDDEIMKVLKPAFGDVRAPRQWYATADRVITQELGLVRHQLDRCIYLSTRHAQDGDDSYRVFNQQGAAYVLDGIFGIHVDDIVGGGEKVWSKEDTMQAGVDEPSCFLDRSRCLLQRFKFGSVDFSPEQVFCGVQIKQSPGLNIISLSLDKYVHHIKPITIDKVRKQMVDEPLLDKEVAQLRSLLGALA